MTQMTFDFSTTTAFATGTSSLTLLVREPKNQPKQAEPRYVPQPKRPTTATTGASKSTGIRTGQSLSLYDSGRKEIHHIGDLAQAVINRYEIVHRRRAARLAREKASREQLVTQTT